MNDEYEGITEEEEECCKAETRTSEEPWLELYELLCLHGNLAVVWRSRGREYDTVIHLISTDVIRQTSYYRERSTARRVFPWSRPEEQVSYVEDYWTCDESKNSHWPLLDNLLDRTISAQQNRKGRRGNP